MYLDEFHVTVARLTRELALVSVSGELDLHTAPDLRDGLEKAGAVGVDTVIVDLSKISFIDSTGLGVLVQGTKRREGPGQSLVLVTNDPRTSRVIEVTGLGRVLPTFATLHDALAHLRQEPPQIAAAAR